jgi:hypothetical protein
MPPQTASTPVVRLDPALDTLISAEARLEIVKTCFGFTEGITWVQRGKSGYLLFSDMPANVIYKMITNGSAAKFVRRYTVQPDNMLTDTQSVNRSVDNPRASPTA